jgi:hypothetical protein
MRSQIATALNTSGVRAQRTIAQAQREGQEVSANAHRLSNAKVGKECWSRLRRVYNAAGGLGGNTLLKKSPDCQGGRRKLGQSHYEQYRSQRKHRCARSVNGRESNALCEWSGAHV